MAKKVDLRKRNLLLKSGKGFLGIILVSMFSGITGAFATTKAKPKKEIIEESKRTAVWG
jgi:hypothetical protein